MATLAYGPRYGLLDNAAIGQTYYDALRQFLQATDSLIFPSSINTTTTVPPSSPNPGDQYLLLNTPSGVWTGYQNYLVYWNAQNTNSGTNTLNPSWLFVKPQAGMIVYDIATALLYLYSAGAWAALGVSITYPLAITAGGTGATTAIGARSALGAAASGTNSDITSLTGVITINNGLLNITAGGVTANALSSTNDSSSFVTTTVIAFQKNSANPSITVGAGAGSGATASLSSGSFDSVGSFVVTTGTGSTANSLFATITFGGFYSSLLKPFITIGNTGQPSANLPIYIVKSNTTFEIYCGGTNPSDSTSYTYDYHVMWGVS